MIDAEFFATPIASKPDAARHQPAAEWDVAQWLNTPLVHSLRDLRGRIVLLTVFDLGCAESLIHGLPLARQMAEQFDASELAVVGLHGSLDGQQAPDEQGLRRYAQEHKLRFPIGIDRRDHALLQSLTLKSYSILATPTLILIDAAGRLRLQRQGVINALYLGAALATLLTERRARQIGTAVAVAPVRSCSTECCPD
jgi:hypothetical protein